ncbi:hypothetical protein PL263_13280 [Methylomonas sp. EFPC3]|uniref:hypothetical protein n=1 Tax=Methylomonas sp. EFPC3 TaxID=3021710 RepID=UPI002415A407|nr:hypothetical protein [Methylomonas sp. EFPC3]WFP49068.1 hypothetical protein PL263_13280 [Methylomonas sp. EFPC3]
MKSRLPVLYLGACLAACSGPQSESTSDTISANGRSQQNAAEALQQAKQAERQVFDSAERQKKQADEF